MELQSCYYCCSYGVTLRLPPQDSETRLTGIFFSVTNFRFCKKKVIFKEFFFRFFEFFDIFQNLSEKMWSQNFDSVATFEFGILQRYLVKIYQK